jgi:hypothetical protein
MGARVAVLAAAAPDCRGQPGLTGVPRLPHGGRPGDTLRVNLRIPFEAAGQLFYIRMADPQRQTAAALSRVSEEGRRR